MKKDIKISIIIVTYNALEYVKKCIASIIKYSQNYDYEIIIIDNNSKIDTQKYLKDIQNKERISKYIENKENVLLTRAQNQGLKISTGEFIIFLNPDTEIMSENWVEELIYPLVNAKDKTAISGPIYNFVPYSPMYGNIDMCCFCVTRELFNSAGYLDERYPWNGAGFMYTCEAWALGYKYKHINTKSIVHYGKKSRGTNSIPNVNYDLKKEMKVRKINAKFSLFRFIKHYLFDKSA